MILNARQQYDRMLAVGRMGIVPFFWVGCAVVYAWGRRYFGAAVGLMAVFVFTQLPGVLGHAGLATTDMAGTAFVIIGIDCPTYDTFPPLSGWRSIPKCS